MTAKPSARYSLAGILLATALSGAAPSARAAQAAETASKRLFTPRDAIELSSFVQPTAGEESAPRPAPIVSPDGRSFLLVTERGVLASNRIESTLWLFDRQAAVDGVRGKSSVRLRPRALATLSATSNQPVLTAVRWLDADRIAFLGRDGSPFQRLFLADRRTGTVTALTPDDRFVSAYDVRGETVAYTALAAVPPKPPESDLVAVAGRSLLSLLYPESPPLADLDGDALSARANSLHVQRKGIELPLAFTWRGKPLKLFASAWSSAPPLALSPDGSSLITLAPVPEIPALWGSYRAGPDAENAPLRPEDPNAVAEDNFYKPLQFVRVDLRTGEVTPWIDAPAARSFGYIVPTQAFWRSDGREALLVNTFLPLPPGSADAAERKERAESPVVAAVDGATGRIEVLTHLHLPRYQAARFYRVNDVSWNAAEETLTLIYAASSAGEAPPPETYRRQSGRWRKIPRPSPAAADARNGDVEIAVEESFDRSPVLTGRRRAAPAAPADPTAPAATTLWDPNPQLAEIALGKVSPYSFEDRDHRAWSGLLAFPPDYDPGKRYPLVIQTHGYARERFFTDGVYTTGNPGRALTARGFLVLQLEMPTRHLLSPADGPFQLGGFEAAIAQLTEEGRIDPRRVGIIGFSFTCFHTLYALTHHPDLFAAASITDGNNMSYSQYLFGEPEGQRGAEATNGGIPWGEGLKSWVERSPDFNLDKVRTPLLIAALERGELLALWEPYAGLRRLGKPVDLLWLRQEDASHVLRQPRHRELSQQSAIDWFEFWLNGREDPDPAKVEQYARWRALGRLARGAPSPPTP